MNNFIPSSKTINFFGHNIDDINFFFSAIQEKKNELIKKNLDKIIIYQDIYQIIEDLMLINPEICIFISAIKTKFYRYINDNKGCIDLLINYINMNNGTFNNLNIGLNLTRAMQSYNSNDIKYLNKQLVDIAIKLLQSENINHIAYVSNFFYYHE